VKLGGILFVFGEDDIDLPAGGHRDDYPAVGIQIHHF
jgi:hypothetical protein